ncbi:SDR family oxidoreductase [Actinoplanes friuliensis]|jgi:nucleoside-diphosphate-sugar epimerase|uniref:NAD-dependent epimerase/dehydratase n=1 Tax=Actinoplanes friuliensis DSM 7358 TaxID=1246995 RepID=U5W1N0_9ACTN|nr:SDR family oxidoreductase [Actinoplanes friuliensis]AGZ43113.1 NAD-dependent epimerase/dehydratase [Actinoplanes friuliensis DSM 7358]
MHVFVTGASGWIGSATVPELIGAGHRVTGLARSEASAAALTAAGAEVVRGTLDDLDVLRDTASATDGVVHLAFKHDIAFSGGFAQAADADRLAIEAFGAALTGSGKPFLIASGTIGVATGRVATEQDGLDAGNPNPRLTNALLTLALAGRDVRASVVRLPPTVHGDGDHGFMATLVGIARAKGVAGYPGDGTSRWPAVHRSDAARLLRLALEQAPAGSVLHATAEEGVQQRDIANVIGRHLGVPVEAVTADDHFSWLSALVGIDSPVSSTATRELLGWQPTGPTLLEDLEQGHYFK